MYRNSGIRELCLAPIIVASHQLSLRSYKSFLMYYLVKPIDLCFLCRGLSSEEGGLLYLV